MNWRPEGWEEHKMGDFSIYYEDEPFEAGADAMLKAVAEEIEKMENPYDKKANDVTSILDVKEYLAFERFRQKILTLLKE